MAHFSSVKAAYSLIRMLFRMLSCSLQVFCWMCSQLKHTLSYDRDKVGRVCDNCFRLLEARSTRSGVRQNFILSVVQTSIKVVPIKYGSYKGIIFQILTSQQTKFRSFTLDGAMGTEEGEEQTEAADDLNTGTELVMGEIYAFLQVIEICSF